MSSTKKWWLYASSAAALISIPLITRNWKWMYAAYKQKKEFYDSKLLFMARHNCVVTYSPGQMSGWPPKRRRRVDFTKLGIQLMYDPLVYFIETANTSLNIAMVSFDFNVDTLINAVVSARMRGVVIKMILNLDQCKSYTNKIRLLQSIGVEVTVLIHDGFISYTMHYKFIVKDYEKNVTGFLCTGSLNIAADEPFSRNDEYLVFSTKMELIKSFDDSFAKIWLELKEKNEAPLNKSVLAQFNI